MRKIVECRDVCKTYLQGNIEVPALTNINFTVCEGDYTAIIGPSGSGKSTLMNLIGCLDTPTSGKLLIDGREVESLTANELADLRLEKIGFVFQNFQLLGGQTALENVELPLTYANIPRKERRQRAEEALARVGLHDRMDFFPNQLSGGQKQRVAIARALVNNPSIVLADEPTGALDSRTGEQVMDLFEELNREGVTVLIITHDRGIASRAGKKVEIRDGKLGDPEENGK
ncbi:MAG: ABC transporter ATP-binding protein [Lachnospiraceae bacterium]